LIDGKHIINDVLILAPLFILEFHKSYQALALFFRFFNALSESLKLFVGQKINFFLQDIRIAALGYIGNLLMF